MARKLTEGERNTINYLTAAFVAALPAHLRSHAGSIASSLVRIPREVITARDINRIVGRLGEDATQKEELRGAIRDVALVSVDVAEGDPESFALRRPEDESAAEGAAAETEPEGANPEPAEVDTAEAEDSAKKDDRPAEEPKPAKRRRRRRVGDRGGHLAEQKAAAEQQEAEVEPAAPAIDAEAAGDDAAAPAAADGAVEPASAPQADAADAEAADDKPVIDAAVPAEDTDSAPAADDAPAADPAAQRPARNGRYRGRRGGQNSGGNPKHQGKSLDQVPYIRRGGQAEADLRARIVQLDQRFWVNGWLLSHPGAFELYEKELLALNEFLVSGTMIGDVTRRQLAYQMGGDEKFFEYGSDGFRLLRSMGVEDLIRHRPLPKPDLLYHAPRRRKHMRVLVTENLDPWLDVRDLMYEEGVSQILGERIHAVVLGGGMPVLEPNRLHLLLDTLGADSYDVLYWGDIDRAGLDILLKLQALLDGKFEVKAFTPAYQLMCDRAMARFPEPGDNEKTGQINLEVGDTSVICDGLTPEAAAYAKAVIEDCCLIPQEILTKRDL